MRHNTVYICRYRSATQEYVMPQLTRMRWLDTMTAGTKILRHHYADSLVNEGGSPSSLGQNGMQGFSIRAKGKTDEHIAMETLLPGKWLTDTVMNKQISSLGLIYQNTDYLQVSFFKRFLDMKAKTYTIHPIQHWVYAPELLRKGYIFVPVARSRNLASL